MYINSMGFFIPQQRVGNDYFTETIGLTDEWIRQRTGIVTRSRASEEETHDSMGQAAVSDAVSRLPYNIKDVDLIVEANYCAYDTVATLAHKVQRKYEIAGAKVVYASSACSSFINGLEIIEGYFASGKATKALIISSEHNTYYSDDHDQKAGHLWGDAAVAFFVSKERMAETDWKVITIHTEGLGHLGKGPDGVRLRPKEDGITMPDGRDVFIHACRYMIYSLKESLAVSGLKNEDIHRFICHQANKRIVAQVAHQLDIGMDNFLNNIEELGNTGSASAALVLAENQDEIPAGSKVALMVFGGGYSCGSFIVEKP